MSIIFIILAAFSNAVMDVLSTRYDVSIFGNLKNRQFWDWRISWKNKWENGFKLNREKFLFSSSILVFLTDAWHLFKALMLAFVSLAIIFYKPIFGMLDVFLFCIIWGVVFEVSYNKILRK
jgi:hypothetical protein